MTVAVKAIPLSASLAHMERTAKVPEALHTYRSGQSLV